MEISEIAAIAGKGGLFHVLKPSRAGMIVETLDDQKKRMMVNINQRVSVLKEVSIYTTSGEGAVPLEEVFQKIYEEFGDDPGVDTSDSEDLKAFLKHVVPDYDESRVYASDMKKLVNWYTILLKQAPEVLEPQEDEKESTEDSENPEATSSADATAKLAPEEQEASETEKND
ncbi:MAG: DUF5606 domain-containing protein [Bacteroidota bacterium]